MLRLFSAICAMVCLSVSVQISAQPTYEKPSDIPVEVFAALPSFSNPKLSPDGSKIAYFIEIEGHKNVLIFELTSKNQQVIRPIEQFDYHNFSWKNNEIILLEANTVEKYYFDLKRTDTRVISYDLISKKFKWLGRPKQFGNPTRIRKSMFISQHDDMIDILPNDPEHILLSLDLDFGMKPAVYKVNVRTGKRATIQNHRKHIVWWYTDQHSNVRMGTGYNFDNNRDFIIKYKSSAGDWIDLSYEKWVDDYDVIGISHEPNTLYVSGRTTAGTKSILKLNILNGAIIKDNVTHTKYDTNITVTSFTNNHVIGVRYADDFWRTKYFDAELSHIQRSLDKAFPNTINSIVSKARDKELYLIKIHTDQNPGDYYFYDRQKKTIGYFASHRESIDEHIMAKTKAVSIPVRDGHKIPGYLTIPHKAKTKNLPTIILPHGGPKSRSTAHWDYEAQFYASRGWLVLKPNFRGSTGYGEAFQKAGEKQWGGLMQDDVTDATHWLIREGMADPERICIVGSSYGGYAALFGTIKEPSLYKCAISINGITDIKRLKDQEKRFTIGGKSKVQEMELEGSNERDISPYHRAKDINTPILLIAAKDDTVVLYKQSKSLYKKLRRLKKPAEYVEIKEGTHYMEDAQSRLTALKASELFLRTHLN